MGIRNGRQKLRCRKCKKYQQAQYKNLGCLPGLNERIQTLLMEGVSIRGMARLLGIALGTILKRIKQIAVQLKPRLVPHQQESIVEIDELWSFVGSKRNEVCITYALERKSRKVIEFQVGTRTREVLECVAFSALQIMPKRICTDGLSSYQNLIPKALHLVGLPHTRHIERYNLSLRTHLKRLSRKTICLSRSMEMLKATLAIYFWGSRQCHGLMPVSKPPL